MARKIRGFNKRGRGKRVIPLLPNIITTGSLTLGLASIFNSLQILIFAYSGSITDEQYFRRIWWAAAFIGIATILDMLDGKIARALGSDSKFGLSYDSLSDMVSFGVAPGVLLYVWILKDTGNIGLMSLLLYIVCVALRLARFNLQSNDLEKKSFTGLPSPMAAGLIISPILLFSEFSIFPNWEVSWFYLVAAPIIGFVMVSEIRYRKFPRLGIRGQFNVLVISAIILTALITHPGIMATCIVYIYFFMGLINSVVRKIETKKTVEEFESSVVKEKDTF